MAIVLGLDASTQSLSAMLVDTAQKCLLAEESVVFGRDLPKYGAPNGFVPGTQPGEILADPCMWLDALDLCLDRLRSSGAPLQSIEAISGAGQQHGTVYLNADGLQRLTRLDGSVPSLAKAFANGFSRPLSPIWMDTSTTAECRAIEQALGGAGEVCRLSGSIATERFSGPQIARFARCEPQAYRSTARIHLVSSFIASVLAGAEAPIEPGDGAGMNLMNLHRLDWEPQLLGATAPNLEGKLPPLRPSNSVIGSVAPYFTEHYGIPASARVVTFTGDNPSSLVGMGATRPGLRVISLGTSDTFFAATSAPVTDPDGCGHLFGNPCGGYFSLQCFVNGSLAREKVRDAAGLDWSGFDERIRQTAPGCEGRLLLPFFNPEISPRLDLREPVAIGDFGTDWRSHPCSPRACVEAQFLNMRLRSAWITEKAEQILLTGGASRNETIAQIIANVFQLPVRRFNLTGSVALGGALRAAQAALGEDPHLLAQSFLNEVSARTIQPQQDTQNLYAEAAQRLQHTLDCLRTIL